MAFWLAGARLTMAAVAVALAALGAAHLLNPEIAASRAMISRYALGRHGWLMALFFGAFSAASVGAFSALVGRLVSVTGRTGLVLLLLDALAFALAARFPMDPVSTPAAERSFSGKMHGVAFLIGLPCQIAAPLLVSFALGSGVLLVLTAVIWLSLTMMIVVMAMVGPGKEPDPKGPVRFLGLPNRLFMVAYGVWLIAAAWPTAS